MGVRDGYDGLIDGDFRELNRIGSEGVLRVCDDIDGIAAMGGTLLGSARSARFRTPEGRAQASVKLDGLDGLIVLGGDGSLTGAHALSQICRVPIVGAPASIDNDIGCTGMAIGVDTALNTITEACDRIVDTARSHRRAFIVEVMGRHSGYLAMASAVAAAADAALIRELDRDEKGIVDSVEGAIRRAFTSDRDRRRVLILKAEGVDVPCTRLVREVQERLPPELGVDVRGTVLGHLVRGGSPSYQDRMIASRLAYAAIETLLAGVTDRMVAWQPPVSGGEPTDDPAVQRFPILRVLEESKALLDGTSPVTQWRVKMMSQLEGVLGL